MSEAIFIKAVILAGGQGSRLRPLTCDIPKPMVRLCSKPTLEYIMSLLIENGIDEAVVTLGYMPEKITEHFSDNRYLDLKLSFVEEKIPLGTAGGVKNAVKDFEENETFVVISGDAVCDYDIAEAVRFHRKNNADATIVLAKVDDPREYGLVSCNSDGRVKGFIEKPSWEQALCKTANTGIYIIKKSCLSLFNDGEEFDFAKDLFPLMLKKDMNIFGFVADGYWCDIGSPSSYIKCQSDMMRGKVRGFNANEIQRGIYCNSRLPSGNYKLIPPVYIGENVSIGNGSVIGPDCVIDNASTIGENTTISSSVILEGALVENSCKIYKSLVCSRAKIKNKACIYENTVIGSDSVVGEATTVKPEACIWPEKKISRGSVVSGNIKFANQRKELFEGDLLCIECFEVNSESCARLGRAIGSLKRLNKIAIASADRKSARALKYAFVSGILSSGGCVWDFGDCYKAQLEFFTNFCSLDMGVFISSDKKIFFCGEGGLPLQRYIQREIEALFMNGNFKLGVSEFCRDVADMSSIKMIYNQELLRVAEHNLEGIVANAECEDNTIKCLFEECVTKVGGSIGSEPIFRFDKYGRRVSAFTTKCGEISHERLLATVALYEFKGYNDIALPYESPEIIEKLAMENNCKVYYYLDCPADDCDKQIRDMAAGQIWTRDALFLAMKVLNILKSNHLTFEELVKQVPAFYVKRKRVRTDLPFSELADYFSGMGKSVTLMPQGFIINSENADISIVPLSTGLGVKLFAQSFGMEAAEEICQDIEKHLEKGV
ncbi:MAG: NTP transferase domain-containing protein [Clostridiales bacterium]|nr:NTP transferase domain-containing protein [Clostridiales bacterium]